MIYTHVYTHVLRSRTILHPRTNATRRVTPYIIQRIHVHTNNRNTAASTNYLHQSSSHIPRTFISIMYCYSRRSISFSALVYILCSVTVTCSPPFVDYAQPAANAVLRDRSLYYEPAHDARPAENWLIVSFVNSWMETVSLQHILNNHQLQQYSTLSLLYTPLSRALPREPTGCITGTGTPHSQR